MDMRKYYDITHSKHEICNPTSSEKINALIDTLDLSSGTEVVDIACGKGEFLIRLAERWGVSGVGYDISSYYIGEAMNAVAQRVPEGSISFVVKSGDAVHPPKPLQVASCIGASWIFGGHTKTLQTLSAMIEPGGWIVVGEPYWLQEPAEEFLKATGLSRELFGTHESNINAGESLGLKLVKTIESAPEDWDFYQELQWESVDDYIHTHGGDPDSDELLEQVQKEKEHYKRWGRETIGWALYLFRKKS